jgi:hypothetical protein
MGDHPMVYIVRLDIDPKAAEAANKWSNESHVPDLLAAGFYSAARFRSIIGAPEYAHVYEIPNADIFYTDSYKNVRTNDPTADRFRWAYSSHTNTPYEVVIAVNTPEPSFASPGRHGEPLGSIKSACIVTVGVDVPPEAEEQLILWHREEHIPLILDIPGFSNARLCRRKGVHPKGFDNGEPTFVTLWEIESPEILSGNSKLDEANSTDWARRIHSVSTNRNFNVMVRIFPPD